MVEYERCEKRKEGKVFWMEKWKRRGWKKRLAGDGSSIGCDQATSATPTLTALSRGVPLLLRA